MPRERWDVDSLYSTEAEPGLSYARFGAFLQVSTSASGFQECRCSMNGGWISFTLYYSEAEPGLSNTIQHACLHACFWMIGFCNCTCQMASVIWIAGLMRIRTVA